MMINISKFAEFLYAQRWHWKLLHKYDAELYSANIDPDQADLKRYQDLLVLAFIREHIPKGARILDVGGGLSRICAHLSGEYECWNIDKFEGIGNGPKHGHAANLYRTVYDYMGNFNQELPDNYFDLVFSISVLEHVPQDDVRTFDNIVRDINRVLKNGGYSLHLFDIVYVNGKVRVFSKLIYYMVTSIKTLSGFIDPNRAAQELELYFMSQAAYESRWEKITHKTYLEFGAPTSINILWRRNE